MYTIYLNDGTMHSIWDSEEDALQQIEVLRDYGYRNCTIVFSETKCYENGYYFV